MNLHLYNTMVKDPVSGEMVELALLGSASVQAVENHVRQVNSTLISKINQVDVKKVNKPSGNGTSGQLLRTNGDGTTQWVDTGLPTDEQTETAINAWLDDHPEATTTVQDGAITTRKLNDDVYGNNPFLTSGITCTEYKHSNGTHYYITYIPYLNRNGNRNVLKQGFANGTYNTGGETVRDFCKRTNAIFAINTGIADTETLLPYGPVVIQDGNNMTPVTATNHFIPCCIKADGELTSFTNQTAYSEYIENNVVYCCTGYYPIVKNSEIVYDQTDSGWTTLYQNQTIWQRPNKDYIVVTCNGKNYRLTEPGLSLEQITSIVMTLYPDVKFGYQFDGGGSVSTVVNKVFINVPSDNYFKDERKVSVIWYVEEGANEYDGIEQNANLIGDLNKKINDLRSLAFYGLSPIGGIDIQDGTILFRDTVNANVMRMLVDDDRLRVTNVTDATDFFEIGSNLSKPYYIKLLGDLLFAEHVTMPTNVDLNISDADDINYPITIKCTLNTIANVPYNQNAECVLISRCILSANNVLQIIIPIHPNSTDYHVQYRYSSSGDFREWRTL